MPLVDIAKINLGSPYRVSWGQRDDQLIFFTDSQIEYELSLVKDERLFGGLVVHNILFHARGRREKGRHSFDKKVKETVFCILSSFLSNDSKVVLYICDSSDSRHINRDRLFKSWLNEADKLFPGQFIVKPIAQPDLFYGAIIFRSDNLHIENYMDVFNQEVKMLYDDKL